MVTFIAYQMADIELTRLQINPVDRAPGCLVVVSFMFSGIAMIFCLIGPFVTIECKFAVVASC